MPRLEVRSCRQAGQPQQLPLVASGTAMFAHGRGRKTDCLARLVAVYLPSLVKMPDSMSSI